jgi:hypothetical protein
MFIKYKLVLTPLIFIKKIILCRITKYSAHKADIYFFTTLILVSLCFPPIYSLILSLFLFLVAGNPHPPPDFQLFVRA